IRSRRRLLVVPERERILENDSRAGNEQVSSSRGAGFTDRRRIGVSPSAEGRVFGDRGSSNCSSAAGCRVGCLGSLLRQPPCRTTLSPKIATFIGDSHSMLLSSTPSS